ncbi:hypothetical protein MW887_009359 [Aspergillus wentii]|nr:hypothetical protein MW887_009359 [Aspergillus wentii]
MKFHISRRVTRRVLRFSCHLLKYLKELATDPEEESWVSTFEALSANLYRYVYRAQARLLKSNGIIESEVASCFSRGFWVPNDLRGPADLNLSGQYFPNHIAPMILPESSKLSIDVDFTLVGHL